LSGAARGKRFSEPVDRRKDLATASRHAVANLFDRNRRDNVDENALRFNHADLGSCSAVLWASRVRAAGEVVCLTLDRVQAGGGHDFPGPAAKSLKVSRRSVAEIRDFLVGKVFVFILGGIAPDLVAQQGWQVAPREIFAIFD